MMNDIAQRMVKNIHHQYLLPGYWSLMYPSLASSQDDISPQFPLPGYWPGESTPFAHEFDGQRYYLCHPFGLQEYVLYRVEYSLDMEPTLFVPCGVNLAPPKHLFSAGDFFGQERPYPKALFAEQVRGGQSGRLMLYNHLSARNCLAALFFAQDGTGQFLDWDPFVPCHVLKNRQPLDFLWDGGRYGISIREDILTCDWQTLLPLCEDVFVNQIWPRMKKPYLIADFPDKLFRFVCGSRKELEHVTRCICHSDPNLFADPADTRSVRVTYLACTSKQQRELREWPNPNFRSIENEASRKMCLLALVHNTFEGETHKYFDGRNAPDSTTLADVQVDAAPPSMHERAEALLFLYDWLEGKVSPGGAAASAETGRAVGGGKVKRPEGTRQEVGCGKGLSTK